MKTSTSTILSVIFFWNLMLQLPAQEVKAVQFSYENFEEQFLVYQPLQKETVSDRDFGFAQMVIQETKKAVKNDPDNFNVGDYCNITTAFSVLDESREHLEMAFKKMVQAEGSCEYLIKLKDKLRFYQEIPDLYERYLKQCLEQAPTSDTFDLQAYTQEHQLDSKLVKLIQQVDVDDQKFREEIDFLKNANLIQKQATLDQKNQKLIDSLYQSHQTYVGKFLVGERFEHVMWQVIQHSDLEMMEGYLPTIQKAVQAQKLHVTPFKMLLDRIYAIKYGYQIFGSQEGTVLAKESIRKKVKEKYGIE